jgi:phosphoribosylformimino-5-aminoimidazole carboxamide ribotide isomerase
MRGVAVQEIRELVRAVGIPVIASGGVGSLKDVRLAREVGATGLVVGMSLYVGRFSLQQAMEVAGE